jgi:PAS domain S-box-containing protein
MPAAVPDSITGAPWRPMPPRSPLNGLLRRVLRRLAGAGILGVAAALTLVALVALVAVTQNQAERTVRAEAREAAESSARSGANVVSAEIRGLQDVVRAYAQRRLLQRQLHGPASGRSRVRRHLRELASARDGISAAWALEPGGRLVDILPATPEIVGRSFAFRDYYRGVMETRRTYASEAFVVASRNHPLSIAVADVVPTPAGGRPGILAAGYDLAAIQRFVQRYAAAERIALTVTDQSGTVVAGPGGPRRGLRFLRDDPLVAAALAGRSGFARRRGPSGPVLAASAPVRGLGWTVTAEVEEAGALAGVASLRETQLMFGVPLGIGLLAGFVMLARTLRRRARAEEALRLSEERALDIVRTSPDAFVALDEAGRITAWNPAAERMFGWSQDEVLERPLTETIVPPELRKAHSAGMARFLRTREPRVIGQSLELPALRRDGSEMPIEIAISAAERPDGMAIHAFIRDISERKRDEEELREAHAQAVEASRLKSEFVANMSHELHPAQRGDRDE